MIGPQILLASALDYAGLFPPASLGMAEAVRNYARYRSGAHRALLGRFVVPVVRLDELSAAADGALANDAQAGWELTVLGGDDPRDDDQRIADIEARHGGGGRSISVRSIELKVETPEQIPDLVGAYHDAGGRDLYLEVSIASKRLDEMLAAIATAGAYAKVRTGGTTAEAFPSTAALAHFVHACSAAGLPFKATAGLHHAVRGEYRLEYGPKSPRAIMHGFVNLFVGAALLDAGKIGAEELPAVLAERTTAAFQIEAGTARWLDREVGAGEIRRARERLLHSFGTCSFEEPIEELRAMGALR
jgi:hypothetical protein